MQQVLAGAQCPGKVMGGRHVASSFRPATLHGLLPHIGSIRDISSSLHALITVEAPPSPSTALKNARVPAPIVDAGGKSRPRRVSKSGKGAPLTPLEQPVNACPGVGPKYAGLLQAQGIRTVRDLLARHADLHNGNMDLTQRFLKNTVGINHSGCLRNIAAFVEQKLQEQNAQKAQQGQAGSGSASWLQPKVTLSVEGNISAGKSTFLKILEGKGLMSSKLQVVPEPVEKWQNVGTDHVNLLMEFYNAPERMAYTFQNYVFLTRMMQERESYTASAMCRLLERSVFSDKMVFVRSVHSAKYMSDTELAIYNSWFDPVLSTLPTLVPNGFIYLRAQPETCHQRLKKRARTEETSVKLDYLQDLHAKHEDWLIAGGDPVPSASNAYLYVSDSSGKGKWLEPSSAKQQQQPGNGSVLQPGLHFEISKQAPQAGITAVQLPTVPAELHNYIRFLDTSRGEHMHPMLHSIPALELDCDTDVDIDRDESYKNDVAKLVDKYCDYVRDYIVARGQAMAEYERSAVQALSGALGNQVILPGGGAFNGYSLNVKGIELYVDSKAPYVAYASREGSILSAAARR